MLALIAAETSKTPFYIAGGVLAGLAVVLSMIGLRSPDFPTSTGILRIVAVLSIAFAVAAMASAVASA